MKNYRIFLWAAVPLLLASCTADELLSESEQEISNGNDVRIPIQVNAMLDEASEADTRAETTVNNYTFGLKTSNNENSKVCLWADASGSYTAYEYKVTGGSNIAPDSGQEIYFPSNSNSVNVYGWYPYNNGDTSFTILGNQSDNANYCLSDVLLANKATSTVSGNVVSPANLEFHHAMAKIVVNVQAKADVWVKKVEVLGVKPTLAVKAASEVDYEYYTAGAFKSGLFTVSGDAINITAYEDATGFTGTTKAVACVIPPQKLLSGQFLRLTINDGTSDATVIYNLSADKTFDSNNTYNITIKAGADEIAENEVDIEEWQVSKGTPIVFKVMGSQLKYTEVEGDDDSWTQTTELTIGDESVYKIKCYIVNSSGRLNSKTSSMNVYSSNNDVVNTEEIVKKSGTFQFRAIGQGVTYINFTYKNSEGVAMGTASLKVTVTANLATSLSQLKDKLNAADSEDNTITAFYMGYYVHNNGDITYENEKRNEIDGDKVVGVIVAASKSAVDINVANSRIMVMAIEDVEVTNSFLNPTKYSTVWSESEDVSASGHVDGNSYRYTEEDGFATYLNGLELTTYLKDNGGTACALAFNYTGSKPSGTSNWFLPSFGQFKLIKDKEDGLRSELSNTEMKELFASFSKIYVEDVSYWTSTEYGTTGKNVRYMRPNTGLSFGYDNKTDNTSSGRYHVVRPFFVF